MTPWEMYQKKLVLLSQLQIHLMEARKTLTTLEKFEDAYGEEGYGQGVYGELNYAVENITHEVTDECDAVSTRLQYTFTKSDIRLVKCG